MGFIIVYVTHPDRMTAEKISKSLVEEKVIACSNTLSIKSCYWWQSAIQNEEEIVTILKTKKENWEKLKARVAELHPYEVPCIMKLEVEANQEYEDWIRTNSS